MLCNLQAKQPQQVPREQMVKEPLELVLSKTGFEREGGGFPIGLKIHGAWPLGSFRAACLLRRFGQLAVWIELLCCYVQDTLRKCIDRQEFFNWVDLSRSQRPVPHVA